MSLEGPSDEVAVQLAKLERNIERMFEEIQRDIAEAILAEAGSPFDVIPLHKQTDFRRRVREMVLKRFVVVTELPEDERDIEARRISGQITIAEKQQSKVADDSLTAIRTGARLRKLRYRMLQLGAMRHEMSFRNNRPISPYARLLYKALYAVVNANTQRHADAMEDSLTSSRGKRLLAWLKTATVESPSGDGE